MRGGEWWVVGGALAQSLVQRLVIHRPATGADAIKREELRFVTFVRTVWD